jgi:hypothetical protein
MDLLGGFALRLFWEVDLALSLIIQINLWACGSIYNQIGKVNHNN